MKVLLLGCYYSPNLGDGVICECVADQIHRAFPEAEITIKDLWNRSAFKKIDIYERSSELSARWMTYKWLRCETSRFLMEHGLCDRAEKRRRDMFRQNAKLLEQICSTECDLVVYAGGQMFMDAYIPLNQAIVEHFTDAGVPVIFNACGIGPAYSGKLRSALSETLGREKVVAISSRDGAGQMNRLVTTAGKRTEDTFDPALGCSDFYQVKADETSETVGLGIMWVNRLSPYADCRFWHNLILTLEERRIPWKIFINGDGTDAAFARYVIRTLPNFNKSFEECCVPAPSNPKELVQTVSRFKSIISFRLHSHIIATSLGVPSVAVVWDDKVRLFFEKIGHPERCCSMKDKPETVLNKLEAAQRKGYDRELIEKQTQYSEEWLIGAIRRTGLV